MAVTKKILNQKLDIWSEERLEGLGIYKENVPEEDIPHYEAWKKQIIDNLRKEYGDKAIEMFLIPKYMTYIENPDVYAKIKGPCGDTIELYLKLQDNKIKKAGFQTDGCESSQASGGMLCEMITGLEIKNAKKITQQDILDSLGGLPEDHQHCPLLAANTLKKALKNIH